MILDGGGQAAGVRGRGPPRSSSTAAEPVTVVRRLTGDLGRGLARGPSRPSEDRFGTAGSVVPSGYARVVRVLHPVGNGTWASVAARTGRTMHPLVQWRSIADHVVDGRSGDIDPEEEHPGFATLGSVLRHAVPRTGMSCTPCGAGSSGVDPPDPSSSGTCATTPSSPARARRSRAWPGIATPWDQSANYVWPTDRSWCVATEIDQDFTLVACADGVAEALLADPDLGTYEVALTDDLTWDGDRLNGPGRA